MIFFSLCVAEIRIPDFIYLIFRKRAVTFTDYWASVLIFFLSTNRVKVFAEFIVYQDRVLRLMSHCFFPMKMYRFLFHTNRCQTIRMCTSCVSSSEHNYRSDFLKINSVTIVLIHFQNLSFFLAAYRNTADKFIVVRTSSQCPVSIGRFAFLCNSRNISLLIIVWCFWNMFWSFGFLVPPINFIVWICFSFRRPVQF